MKAKAKNIAKYAIKLALSALALWFVFTKVDWAELGKAWKSASVSFIVLAMVCFVASKMIAAYRLNLFFRHSGIVLGYWQNAKLYLLGMYYNLFLPGGIGGDGYKVYLLRKSHGKSLKSLTWVMLLDRLGGLAAIGLLLAIGSFVVELPGWVYVLSVAALLLIPIVGYLLIKQFFNQFKGIYLNIIGLSVLVQFSQVLSAVCLLIALGENAALIAYALLFLVSSVAAMLPLSLGGLGAREVAMYYMAEYFSLNSAVAMSVSLIFYAISALVSLSGIYFSFNTRSLGLEINDSEMEDQG